MRILMTGHAGLFIETNGTSVLCDPWFNAAYLGSWFPFPDNAGVDVERISSPDYLYVSHLHKDHFDRAFLSEHVDKAATVLLPDFPIPELREALEGLGFRRFVQTRAGRPVELEGLRVAIATSTSVADGPIGDSALVVDDGTVKVLDQNDCHPRDLAALRALGPYDAHFLQYSGAIWYPMVYRWAPAEKAELAAGKRTRQAQRARDYISELRAAHVIPFAGPPAFLDDDLFELNDLDDDPANIFQDQRSFLRELAANGMAHGHLAVAGSELTVTPGRVDVAGGEGTPTAEGVFENKEAYLRAYQERRRGEIAAARAASVPARAPEQLVAELASWIEPLLADASTLRSALGGMVLLDVGAFGVVIDPLEGTVRLAAPDEGARAEHAFFFDEAILESLVDRRVEDWVNELFLSCRFTATRRGGYNEAVFSFFKCLSPRRMAYLEASLTMAARANGEGRPVPGELWRCGDHLVQRRCPHLGADLSRFGQVEDGVLTCSLHGNRYDLATGRCLSAEGMSLFSVPVDGSHADAASVEAEHGAR